MTNTSTTEFDNVGQLIAAVRKLKGAIFVDAMVGAGYDPIEVQVVKSDLIETLTHDFAAEGPAPFYLHVNSLGAQFLISA